LPVEWFASLDHVTQALAATLLTWLMTAAGASLVFLFRDINKRLLDALMGFAAGVMLAASVWSLLLPALAMPGSIGLPSWAVVSAGFMAGGVFLWCIDSFLPHLHVGFSMEEAEGIRTGWRRSTLLVLALTLHNIPEGLAIGVAFAALAAGSPSASLAGAVSLAIGIGIQNIPEGLAVAAPLRKDGMSRMKSFWYGQLSGVVEPVAAATGSAWAVSILGALPLALSFAAGAMIYVVVEELIPESQHDKHTHVATFGLMLGFVVMMVLDVALG